MMEFGGLDLLGLLYSALLPVASPLQCAPLAQATLLLCWRCARIEAYKLPLMKHVHAAARGMVMMCHVDVAAVVEYGLAFLMNVAAASETRLSLMGHLRAVMSAMARHADSVAETLQNERLLIFFSSYRENRLRSSQTVDHPPSS